ncbi:PAS domain-containing protein [Candidatus Bathyarchaeota archaeon]|nr:PAS domain-containing protein [Candidatus Bathyarchaeota archaeon]
MTSTQSILIAAMTVLLLSIVILRDRLERSISRVYNTRQKSGVRDYILEEMRDAVLVLDDENKIVDHNQAALNLFSSGSMELAGRKFDELGFEWVKDLTFRSDEITSSKEVKLGEGENERVYEVQTMNFEKGSPLTFLKTLIIKDMTVHRRARTYWETQLRRYSEYLKGVIAERTKQLKEAERLAAIGELAAMVGHDIRNPLTAISGACYYLRKRSSLGADDRSREMLEFIEGNVEYSNKIVSDLLEYSRDLKLNKTPVVIKELLEDSLSSIEIPRNVQIINEVDEEEVEIDGHHMKRVFINMLKNAFDAMPEGGTLTLTSGRSPQGIKVSFADTGVGIPDEIMEEIWKPLFTTKAKGMGFGLAICRRIVKGHGGELYVVSQLGKGTIFTVSLPFFPMSPSEQVLDGSMLSGSLTIIEKADDLNLDLF